VSITSVYADINPEVVGMTDLPINLDPKDIPECDLLISNSDNPMNDYFSTFEGAKKKILLKLSHNARFKQLENDSLKLPWDAVVTSSQWLADVCGEPIKGWDHPSVEATRVGWFHYAHELMKRPIGTRNYGDGKGIPFVIGTLIHHHPLKGTKEAMKALLEIKKAFGKNVEIVGIGEVDPNQFKPPVWMSYVFSPTRDKLANVLAEVDVWLGASHTEGLGRMALEAMSAGAACVLTNTGAEFAEDGENCLIVPIADDTAMVAKVTLLLQNPDLLAKIRTSGYKTAEDCSDPTEYIDNIESVISEVFNG
jgi:glycosyltransferase involved in cell wall biosynthesis